MSPPQPVLTRRDRIRNRIVAVVAMVLVWTLLWGEFTGGNLITGLVAATAVLVFFPLPPVTFAGRLRPLGLLRLWYRFTIDLVVASVQLAWLAFRFGHVPGSAVAAVQLRVHSDLNLTLVAEAVSLTPGSLIVEADRSTGTLYIHILGVESVADVEQFRQGVFALEGRIVRAIGSDAELRLVGQPPPTGPPVTEPGGEPS